MSLSCPNNKAGTLGYLGLARLKVIALTSCGDRAGMATANARLQDSLNGTQERLEQTTRPLARKTFLCMAKCYENKKDPIAQVRKGRCQSLGMPASVSKSFLAHPSPRWSTAAHSALSRSWSCSR